MDKRKREKGETIVSNEIIHPTITIRKANPKEEQTRVSQSIVKLPFYKTHNYKIILPSKREINVKTDPNYYSNIQFIDSNPQIYREAIKIQELGRVKIIQSYNRLNEFHKLWRFDLFQNYSVVLTRYGTGGSYSAETGKIIQRLDRLFGTENDPAKTPIHEIVHIGLEKFIKKFGLRHTEKEGLVDGLCFSTLQDILPNYPVQNLVDKNIFQMVTLENAWQKIPDVLTEYVKQYPR